MAQHPDSTNVAGYQAWQSMGRQVRKGETGIVILVPVIRRRENEDSELGEKERAVVTWCRLGDPVRFDDQDESIRADQGADEIDGAREPPPIHVAPMQETMSYGAASSRYVPASAWAKSTRPATSSSSARSAVLVAEYPSLLRGLNQPQVSSARRIERRTGADSSGIGTDLRRVPLQDRRLLMTSVLP